MAGVDVLSPPSRIVYVAGEALDFTFVTTRTTLKGLKVLDEMKKGNISEFEGMEQIIGVLVEQCSKTNPNITVDWFLDNTSIDTIMKMGSDLAGVSGGEGQDKNGEPAKN